MLCATALAVAGRLFGAHYVWRWSTMLLPGLVAPGIPVVFDNLENYTGLVRPTTIDASLHRIDLALFGVEPTVWMRHLYAPLVTDWMASCYAIFLVTPMVLAIVVSLRGRRDDFREMAAALLRAAARRAVHDAAAVVLRVQRRAAGAWDTYSPLLVRASFPSLHCAYATLTLVYAWRCGDAVFARHRRAFFFVVLPLELSLRRRGCARVGWK